MIHARNPNKRSKESFERTWKDAAAELRALRSTASRTLQCRAYENAGVGVWLMLAELKEKIERQARVLLRSRTALAYQKVMGQTASPAKE